MYQTITCTVVSVLAVGFLLYLYICGPKEVPRRKRRRRLPAHMDA